MLLRTTDGRFVLFEPTTELICAACRMPVDIYTLGQDTMDRPHFMFDLRTEGLSKGDYWYFHKRCDRLSGSLDVSWGWHEMDYVLGVNKALQRMWGKFEKRIPQATWERLTTDWGAAMVRYGHPESQKEQREVQRKRRILDAIIAALESERGEDLAIYAQTCCDSEREEENKFWYKVFFFTRHGVLKLDTGSETLDTKENARAIIRSQKLRPVSLEGLVKNWLRYGIWKSDTSFAVGLARKWVWKHGKNGEGWVPFSPVIRNTKEPHHIYSCICCGVEYGAVSLGWLHEKPGAMRTEAINHLVDFHNLTHQEAKETVVIHVLNDIEQRRSAIQKGRPNMSVQFFKQGLAFALQTDCNTEELFMEQFCTQLSEVIEEGKHAGEWEFHLRQWLPQCVELCNAYRGYKAKVVTKTVYTVGEIVPGEPLYAIQDVGVAVAKNGRPPESNGQEA